MDHRLIDLLVCPLCKGPLTMQRSGTEGAVRDLVCAADRLAFPVRDGIPVMLESEARALDAPPAPAKAPAPAPAPK
ncbi:MAG: Trm112 family protein [Burkholderiaceae bacterium]